MEKRGSYVLGILLVILGLTSLLGSLIIAYLDMTGVFYEPKDFFKVLTESRKGQYLDYFGIGLTLATYMGAGIVLLGIGGGLLALKRRIVPLVEEVTMSLRCSSCGNQWEEPIAKTTLEAMGYPSVKSLSRRRCSKCGRFIRPRIVAVEGWEKGKK